MEFLTHLLRHLRGPVLVIWDRLQTHRSRLVREFADAQEGRLALEYLPAYAPELNPVEYIWGHWKHHELPNFCPDDFAQLSQRARRALGRMRRAAHPRRYIRAASGASVIVTMLCGALRAGKLLAFDLGFAAPSDQTYSLWPRSRSLKLMVSGRPL